MTWTTVPTCVLAVVSIAAVLTLGRRRVSRHGRLPSGASRPRPGPGEGPIWWVVPTLLALTGGWATVRLVAGWANAADPLTGGSGEVAVRVAAALAIGTLVAAAVGLGVTAGNDRGSLLDAGILAVGTAMGAWVISRTLAPGADVDVSAIAAVAVSAGVVGVVLTVLGTVRVAATRRWLAVAAVAYLVARLGEFAAGLDQTAGLDGGIDDGSGGAAAGLVLRLGADVFTVVAALGVAAAWLRPAVVAEVLGGGPAREVPMGRAALLVFGWTAPPLLLAALQLADVALDPRPLIIGWVVMAVLAAARVVDVSAHVARVRADRDASLRFRAAFDEAVVGMALVELDGPAAGTISEVNATLGRIYGTDRESLIGLHVEQLVADAPSVGRRQQDRPLAGVISRLQAERRVQLPAEVSLVTFDDRPAWGVLSLSTADGVDRRQAVLQVDDVTERRVSRERLSHLSMHDPLTGLANRRLLDDRLAAAVARAARTGVVVAVLVVDLDQFAAVNIRHGAEAGDEVLVEAGSRLRAVTRPADVVARVGADRFAILLDGLGGDTDALTIADRVRTAVARPFHLGVADVTVSAGIGLALGGTGSSPDLFADATLALARAKIIGPGRVVVFDDALRVQVSDRARLVADLREAVGGSGLRVVYRPVVALDVGRDVLGWVAEPRWDRPGLGVATMTRELSIADFGEVAEASGLIVGIGQRTLELSLAALPVLGNAAGITDPAMTVSVSARQFGAGGLAARVARAVETAGVDPARLCLAVTEPVVNAGGEDVLATLRDLRTQGVQVWLDAFGTGHTSLTHLRRLPIDVLSLDASLVAGLDRGGADVEVVVGIVQLATGLGVGVMAGGVHAAAQDGVLARLGVRAAHGDLYGGPSPAPWPGGEPGFGPHPVQRLLAQVPHGS